jgi:hypothetical protein
LLAIWEVGVGILLIANTFRRTALLFALVHILCTFIPLVVFPALSFKSAPFVFTLLGQYIGKNVIILAALFFLMRERVEVQ